MQAESAVKPSGNATIRVLIVDDSPMIGNIFTAMLEDTPGFEVLGQAKNGVEAVRMTMRLKPDVITMDIRMPQMDGLEATRRIMSVQPTPIVIVSSSVYASDYGNAFNAIEAGALTVIEKPKGLGENDFEAVRAQLITAVRAMSDVKVVSRPSTLPRGAGIGLRTAVLHDHFARSVQVVAIAASTGGPPVLMQIFSALPKDFCIPIVVVQHILPQFAQGLVEWLNTRSALPVTLATHGEHYTPGRVHLCPGDVHMAISRGGIIQLERTEPIHGQRPSASRLFDSVATTAGAKSVGIILTGMGDDGVDGLEMLNKAGGHVIAQDEASCAIFGMPMMAIKRRVADEVLSPEEMVTRLTKLHHHLQLTNAGPMGLTQLKT